jgi:hypothetical protein
MSKRPPKKSDMNKGWMKQRNDKGKMVQPEYHLIVTEGTKTEPQYFNAIRDIINSKYKGRIFLQVHGEGDNTLNLFDKAKQMAEKSSNVYKHVWLVYDTDDFPAERINKTVENCTNISNNNDDGTEYHELWSNQCIELWFLLHFGYLQSDLHRNEYYPKLSNYLKEISGIEYKKNRNDIYDALRPYMEIAIANAKKLNKANEKKTPSKSAPGTKIYELIEKLYPYLCEDKGNI